MSVVKSGSLRKFSKSILSGGWNRCHVVLYKDQHLMVYKKQGDSSPMGKINMFEVRKWFAYGEHTAGMPERPQPPSGSTYSNMIGIPEKPSSKAKIHWFLTDAESDVHDWMQAICSTLPPPPEKHKSKEAGAVPAAPIQPQYAQPVANAPPPYPGGPPMPVVGAPPPVGGAPPPVGFDGMPAGPPMPQPGMPQPGYQPQPGYPQHPAPGGYHQPPTPGYPQQPPHGAYQQPYPQQPPHGAYPQAVPPQPAYYPQQPAAPAAYPQQQGYYPGHTQPTQYAPPPGSYPRQPYYQPPQGGYYPGYQQPTQHTTVVYQQSPHKNKGFMNSTAGQVAMGAALGYGAGRLMGGGMGCGGMGFGWGRGSWSSLSSFGSFGSCGSFGSWD